MFCVTVSFAMSVNEVAVSFIYGVCCIRQTDW